MTDKELKDLVASLAVSQKETDKQLKETDRQLKETDRQLEKIALENEKTDARIKETNKQIGGLANKFGSYTEGLALPSLSKIMTEKFKMEYIQPSVRIKKGKEELEIDVLAYANSKINKVFIIEVKSKVREETFEQLENLINRFFKLFPEHKNKKLYAMVASVDVSSKYKKKILEKGWYNANISNDTFKLDVPKNFKPRFFHA